MTFVLSTPALSMTIIDKIIMIPTMYRKQNTTFWQ